MKTRNGFVSNSSSSSFIVIGGKLTESIKEKLKQDLTKEQLEDDEWLYDDTISKKTGGLEAMFTGDNERIIGLILADVGSDGDYLERKDHSLEELTEMFKTVREKLGGVEVKLMFGTRPS